MAYNTLKIERRDGIATLRLNRPERLNALTVEMGRELKEALEELKEDLEARVLVLTGEGRAFCAGEDVKERPGDSSEAREQLTPLSKFARVPAELMRFADSFRRMTKPTIASINGPAVGQGLSWPWPATSASLPRRRGWGPSGRGGASRRNRPGRIC